jgi:putative ABC transport system substrate-binding protein
MLSRRAALATAAAALVMSSMRAGAQQAPRALRVGYVGIQPREAPIYAAFLKRMTELGYHEGKNFLFEYRQTASIDGYDGGYRELALRKVDVMLAAGSEPSLRAARAAAGTVPIAFLAIDFDPVSKGHIESLARPGGNVTGIVVRQLELAAKRTELLREAIPKARAVGLIWDEASRDQADAAAESAKTLAFEPRLIAMTEDQPKYGTALGAMDDIRGEPVIIPASPIFLRDRSAIAQALLDHGLPSISAFRDNAEAGALMSYGIDLAGLFRNIADCVDRLARGANPAEMPIENASEFHMTVNLKTAAALGIAMPESFTARAHEVFE